MADKKNTQNNETKYSFTSEELNFLAGRQEAIVLATITVNDVKTVMNNFILTVVYPRLGLDPEKVATVYDIVKGTLTVTPRIIVPDAKPATPKIDISK